MLQEEIIEFAKLLVQNVRDYAIRSSDVQLYTNNLNSPIANRWRAAENNENIKQMGEMIISDTVDNTIFYFLQAIDEGLLNVSFSTKNGKVVNLTNDVLGELSGFYMGEWRSEYSEERCSNDFDGI
jgi:hypothetical protein